MNLWWILIAGGLLTVGTRLSFIFLLDRLTPPAWLYRGLRFVPVAVLMAIVVTEVISHSGSPDFTFSNFRLVAALVAAAVAWRTRSALLTIVVGMAVLLALHAIWPS
jgi:branched-subunit amino acid transport protein